MVNRTSRPLVSIITPFFNSEQFLEECIDSVLSQTYSNWELILINDGSSDSSINIASRYSKEYPDRVRYVQHANLENRGASASRNLGFKYAKGEFIAFLDSDDVYLPLKLEQQVPLLMSHPRAGMLYASTEYWYSWTGNIHDFSKDSIWDYFGVKPNTLVNPPDLLALFLRDGDTVPCLGSTLVRREAIISVGGWEDSFKFINTDQVFHAKICLRWPVYIDSGCYDRYRQHKNSSTHLVEKQNAGYDARYKYLIWLEKYIVEQNAHGNVELWHTFNNAMKPYKFYRLSKIFTPLKIILMKIKRKLSLSRSAHRNFRY